MGIVKLFYGSTNGNTERVAEMIKDAWGDDLEMMDISEAEVADLEGADALILGTSTWNDGQLQDDWEDFSDNLGEIDFSGKKVAVFGLGDSVGYSTDFVSGMGILAKKIKAAGATLVGAWPTAGYEFEGSEAVDGDSFLGLAIDEDNEDDKTEERVQQWVAQVKNEIA